MLVKYDEKTIPYTIEYTKENIYKIWLNSQIHFIYTFYETGTKGMLLVNAEAYAVDIKAFSFHFFYFKNDFCNHFNLREYRHNDKKYKAERFLNKHKNILSPIATIFKDIYEDIPQF